MGVAVFQLAMQNNQTRYRVGIVFVHSCMWGLLDGHQLCSIPLPMYTYSQSIQDPYVFAVQDRVCVSVHA